jgi:hypothetical protein
MQMCGGSKHRGPRLYADAETFEALRDTIPGAVADLLENEVSDGCDMAIEIR